MTKYLSLLALAVLLVGCNAAEEPASEPAAPAAVEASAATQTPAPDENEEGNQALEEIAEDLEVTGDIMFDAALEELELLEK